MGYDRGDSFIFDLELNGFWFGSKSNGKLSPRSDPIQFERKWNTSFLSVAVSGTESRENVPECNSIYFLHSTTLGINMFNMIACGDNIPSAVHVSFVSEYCTYIHRERFKRIDRSFDYFVWFQINRKMVYTIWFRFDLIRFLCARTHFIRILSEQYKESKWIF